MNRLITKKIVTILPLLIGLILGVYYILINENVNPMIGLFLGFLLGVVVSTLFSVISWIKSKYISESLEKIMSNIFLIGLILTILLTVLLSVQWIPNYFNSLYILFGSIMVAAIGFYINSRLENEKEYRKIIRFSYIVKDNINNNKKIAEKLNYILNKFGGRKLEHLNIVFFDILTSEMIIMDLKPDFVLDLISIKELTFNINDSISKRNNILNLLNKGIPPEAELYDIYDDIELAELSYMNRKLKKDFKTMIKKSSKFLEKKYHSI
ncbi:TM7S3/TM198-like domain-containing protein [Methanobacterium formicicum]|uniref:DUF4203 domain-containing protein n=1 Tax=Methanobacterium formicicum TaxID=2162 RepID=A0A843AL72_METFO|nr:DUF4203 domain-containing protein [Methanobacterium formicicum]MBF4474556.1 DUF4203 domain-containing protein [Methanobacterium formicicum]